MLLCNPRWVGMVVIAGWSILGLAGCSQTPDKPRAVAKLHQIKPTTKPVDAWSNARFFCVLPLAKAEIPKTGGQLGQSIVDAWRTSSLKFKNPGSVVTIVGGKFPAIADMRVNLTDSELTNNKKSRQLAEPKPTTQGILVDRFALIAEPSIVRQSRFNMQVTGTNMRFDLQKDKDGKPILVMADANGGFVHFDAAVSDIERLMLSIAQEESSKKAIFVRSIKLKLTSFGPHSLDVVLTVRTLVGLVPAGLTFTSRVDIDEKMNAKLSNLTVEGDELLGPLITQFIRPSLTRYEGKTKPLVSFPNEAIQLKSVSITGGDHFTLDAAFAK